MKSAVEPNDYPAADRPEIALVGRSNAGKSTLLNAMTGGEKVAKVSGTPGKTRLLNFFDVGQHYRIVDLPGYGYAARDSAERQLWGRMINTYFKTRDKLAGLILICDVRREWTDDEKSIVALADSREVPVAVVLSKTDKLGRSESLKLFNGWMRSSGLARENFFPVSALKNDGVRELEDYIFKTWIKPLTQAGK